MTDLADEALEQMERATLISRAVTQNIVTEGSPSCLDCGAEIPPARRAAVPSTVLCIDCQSEVE